METKTINHTVVLKNNDGFKQLWWLFAVVYTFIKWGFWWGLLSIFLPIFPIIDLIKAFF